jgi:hypothetical protein
MSRKWRFRYTALVAVLMAAWAAYAMMGAPLAAQEGTLSFDVAENATLWVSDSEHQFDDGSPSYGNVFVTQGYIYPAGTLNSSNGVLPNGDPEYPDQVIGTWYCRGWLIGDGAHTETGPFVITTQYYDLGDSPGNNSVVTEGFELIDLNVAVQRAVTGGTGHYQEASGVQTQELLGFNATQGENLHVEISVTMPSDQ